MGWTADPERLEKVKWMPRSVSQVKEYLPELGGCPHRYYLGRVVKAWERPAAWSPQGTAVHGAAEFWERSKRTATREAVHAEFRRIYAEEINKLTEDTPNWSLWFNSGPYEGAEDTERRYATGLKQVDAYLDYYEATPAEVIWITPDGEPAIELEFNVDLDGVQMRGFIDQVVQVRPPLPDKPRTNSGAVSKSKAAQIEWASRLTEWEALPDVLRPRDIKTGAKPGDAFQTDTYGIVIEQKYPGVVIDGSDFWMARNGGPTKPYPRGDRARVVELVHRADAGIKAGEFPANPGDHCDRCPFRTACDYAE